jgi:hypothetical protein
MVGREASGTVPARFRIRGQRDNPEGLNSLRPSLSTGLPFSAILSVYVHPRLCFPLKQIPGAKGRVRPAGRGGGPTGTPAQRPEPRACRPGCRKNRAGMALAPGRRRRQGSGRSPGRLAHGASWRTPRREQFFPWRGWPLGYLWVGTHPACAAWGLNGAPAGGPAKSSLHLPSCGRFDTPAGAGIRPKLLCQKTLSSWHGGCSPSVW